MELGMEPRSSHWHSGAHMGGKAPAWGLMGWGLEFESNGHHTQKTGERGLRVTAEVGWGISGSPAVLLRVRQGTEGQSWGVYLQATHHQLGAPRSTSKGGSRGFTECRPLPWLQWAPKATDVWRELTNIKPLGLTLEQSLFKSEESIFCLLVNWATWGLENWNKSIVIWSSV